MLMCQLWQMQGTILCFSRLGQTAVHVEIFSAPLVLKALYKSFVIWWNHIFLRGTFYLLAMASSPLEILITC